MMTAMSTSTLTFFGIGLIVIGLLAAGCSDSSDAATQTAEPTDVGSATPDPSSTVESDLPDWVQDRINSGDLDGDGTDDSLVRYVAGTGGGGVAHRTACDDAARLTTVWPEGTKLEVVPASGSDCGSWTLLTDGETTSRGLEKYLDDSKPVQQPTGGGGGGGTGGGNGAWVQVLEYGAGKWHIPLSELRIATPGDTWCDVDSWHDPAGGDYLVKTADGSPFVNPDPQRCGFGAVGTVPVIWVPRS